MEAEPIHLRSGTSIEFVYRDPDLGISAQVDCRLLFLGAHFFEVRRAYATAIRIFEESTGRIELRKRLAESPEILRHYEIGESEGKVALTMREATFRAPGPTAGIEFAIRFTHRAERASVSARIDRFAALRRTYAAARRVVAAKMKSHGHLRADCPPKIAPGLVVFSNGSSERALSKPTPALEARGRVARTGLPADNYARAQHPADAIGAAPWCWSIRSYTLKMGSPKSALEIFRTRPDAICCSHSHWDHCNPETLIRFDKSIPVLIPKVTRPSVFNPPILPMLEKLGFTGYPRGCPLGACYRRRYRDRPGAILRRSG